MENLTTPTVQWAAAIVFAVALLHTFACGPISHLAVRWPRHARWLHLLGEVELVFCLWAAVLLCVVAGVASPRAAAGYAISRQYTEPLFVFAVMVIAGSRPVAGFVTAALRSLGRGRAVAEVWLGLGVAPLLGSLITEPAAMTIAAMALAPLVFRPDVPARLKYAALGVLFVNVSIGGTLTAYAAPPVLMVASRWQWDSWHLLTAFGWKAALAVAVNATAVTWALRRHLPARLEAPADAAVPLVVTALHLALLAGVVASAHHPAGIGVLFAVFLAVAAATKRFQGRLILREAALVGLFLAGLVVLGGLQAWWLQPLVDGLTPGQLFVGATALTGVVDNAALTYLGAQVPGLSDAARYMLVAGAVAGGGLTVIANAPNPAGAALLRGGFRDGAIGAGGLLLGALPPTLVAMAALFFL